MALASYSTTARKPSRQNRFENLNWKPMKSFVFISAILINNGSQNSTPQKFEGAGRLGGATTKHITE